MADFRINGTVSVTCPLGIAPWLEQEVKAHGFKPVQTRETGLELKASLNECVYLNYWLRTAHRIHYLINEKPVQNTKQLYEWIYTLPWQEWIHEDGYFSVTSRVDHASVTNSQIANLTVKDAVADKMRNLKGTRPDSGSDLKQAVLFLYWDRNIARIFIDTSGESLSRRGYRSESVPAPMQESLAAAILMAADWKPENHLINPMCGSGTVIIEAALMAQNRPPATLRNNFGFMYIPGFDREHYLSIRNRAKEKSLPATRARLIASDSDKKAILAARKNARTAGVDHQIDFETCDFKNTTIPDGSGTIVINPPYGKRLEEEKNLKALYREIGNFMKQECAGKTGFLLTGNFNLAKKVGLRSSERIPFFNSTVECRLIKYELYRGSRQEG